MEALAAIGLAGNILTFIEFGYKLVTLATDVYESRSGASKESRSYAAVMSDMKSFATDLKPPSETKPRFGYQEVYKLAAECEILADEIVGLFGKVEPSVQGKPSRTIESLRAAFRTKRHEVERQKLEVRLIHFKSQLHLRLSFLNSAETQDKLDMLAKSALDNTTRLDDLQNHLRSLREKLSAKWLSAEAQEELRSLLGMTEQACESIIQKRVLDSLAFDDMHVRYESLGEADEHTLRWIYDDDTNSRSGGSRAGRKHEAESDAKSQVDDSGPGEWDTGSDDEAVSETSSQIGGPSIKWLPVHDDTLQNNDTGSYPSGRGESDVELGGSDESADESPDESDEASHETDEASLHVDCEKLHARKLLVKFLSSGTGIFHIAGKMGSGKSTLMKYLSSHDTTRAQLEAWAGHRKLVLASFFFWNPGSAMQKSLSGLYRSLLHGVLEACPDLIRVVLPRAWKEASKAMPWQSTGKMHLPDKDVREAFSHLVSSRRASKGHCFCFFIDGLDEYQTTCQEDATTLVELITGWASGSTSNVKLCVSSREYNAFMNGFSSEQRIFLQEINRGDIQRYTEKKMASLGPEAALQLSYTVAKQSSGIFLWTGLVVERMRAQIENGVMSLDQLELEVESLPRELYDLFSRLLDSLPDTDATRIYQIFAILLEFDTVNFKVWGRGFVLELFCLLEEYRKNPNFASKGDFCDRAADGCLREARLAHAKKQLIACSKGLLVVDVRDGVDFTHKSVPEFLSRPAQQDVILRALGDISALEVLGELTLGALQWSAPGCVTQGLEHTVTVLVRLRGEAGLDKKPYHFLESLAKASERHQTTFSDESLYIASGFESYISVFFGSEGHRHLITLRHPIYAAIVYGYYDYAAWKLSQNSHTIPHLAPIDLLNCVFLSTVGNPTCAPQHPGTLLDCIISSDFGPDSPWPKRPGSTAYYINFDSTPDNELENPAGCESPDGVTLWHFVVLRCRICELFGDIVKQSSGYVLEAFLEAGADPDVRLSFRLEPSGHMFGYLALTTRVKGEQRTFHLTLDRKWYPGNSLDCHQHTDESLDNLVDRWDFENNARIHELIQRNRRLIATAADGPAPRAQGTEVTSGVPPQVAVGGLDTSTEVTSGPLPGPVPAHPERFQVPGVGSCLLEDTHTMSPAAPKRTTCRCRKNVETCYHREDEETYFRVALTLVPVVFGLGLLLGRRVWGKGAV